MREDINLNHLIEWKLNLLSEISTIIFNPLEEETSDRSVLSAASHVMILSLTLSDIKNAAINSQILARVAFMISVLNVRKKFTWSCQI